MEKTLIEYLNSALPSMSTLDRDDMIRVILERPLDRSMRDVATSLAYSDVGIGELLSVLLQCELLCIQDLNEQSQAEDVNAMLTSYSLCLEHFKELQASTVFAYDQKLNAVLDEDMHKDVLSLCKTDWAKQGVVPLHNYFYEIPVTAKAEYQGSGSVNVKVLLSPELSRVFAVSNNMREAFVRSPDEKYIIRLGALDCSGERLNLVMRSIEPAKRELRNHVRIQPLEEQTEVRLGRHGAAVQARMHDISIAGLGVDIPLDAELQPGELVSCLWQIGESKLFMEALVRWVVRGDANGHAGLKFITSGPFDEIIRKFMLSEQQKLIGRIRKLATPSWMGG